MHFVIGFVLDVYKRQAFQKDGAQLSECAEFAGGSDPDSGILRSRSGHQSKHHHEGLYSSNNHFSAFDLSLIHISSRETQLVLPMHLLRQNWRWQELKVRFPPMKLLLQ